MNIKVDKNLKIAISSIMLTIIFIVILNVLLSLGRGLNIEILSNSVVVNSLLELVIFLAQVVILKIILRRKTSLEDLSLKTYISVSKDICVGIITTALYMILSFTGLVLIGYLHFEGFGFQLFSSKEVLMSIINSFMIAIFAAVCEEVFFRGVLCNYLSKFKGEVFGIITSSILFSGFHCMRYSNIKDFIFIFCSGIVLGYFFLKTKSLFLSMAIHFTIDFISFSVGLESVGFLVFKQNVSLSDLDNAHFIIEMIIYFVFMGIYMFINRLKIKRGNRCN